MVRHPWEPPGSPRESPGAWAIYPVLAPHGPPPSCPRDPASSQDAGGTSPPVCGSTLNRTPLGSPMLEPRQTPWAALKARRPEWRRAPPKVGCSNGTLRRSGSPRAGLLDGPLPRFSWHRGNGLSTPYGPVESEADDRRTSDYPEISGARDAEGHGCFGNRVRARLQGCDPVYCRHSSLAGAGASRGVSRRIACIGHVARCSC